jgi:hypothetical protein
MRAIASYSSRLNPCSGGRRALFDKCIQSGCTPQECDTDSSLYQPACTSDTKVQCARRNLECVAALRASDSSLETCRCTREMMQCLKRGKCQLDEANIQEVRHTCAANGCSNIQCGLCEAVCNTTVLACSDKYLECRWSAVGREQLCACASRFWHCTKTGGCLGPETVAKHSEMCMASQCAAHECGLEPEQSVCNRTSLKCADDYLACTSSTMLEEDPCDTNFKSRLENAAGVDEYGRASGLARLCTDPNVGGLSHCRYLAQRNKCTGPGHCQCSKKYVSCVGEQCLDAPSSQKFTRLCLEDGCTAEECGSSQPSCNQTGLLCASEYLECQGAQAGVANLALGHGEPQAGCRLPGCERNFFACMKQRSCLSAQQIAEQGEKCLESNCTYRECGLEDREIDDSVLPDSPDNLQLTSMPGKQLLARWTNSFLANEWAYTGSANRVRSFRVELDSNCVLAASTGSGAICANLTVEAHEVSGVSFRFIFSGLTYGIIYRVSVFAYNREGFGPPARRLILLAGPPDPVASFNASQNGPMAVRLFWMPPPNYATLQNAPIQGYRLVISPSVREVSVSLTVPPSTGHYDVNSFVSGTFLPCAVEGKVCRCAGQVRFGPASGSMWSPLITSNGSGIVCAPRSGFRLDIETNGQGQCQCNSKALPLIKGRVLHAQVSAYNVVGESDAQEVAIRVMGRPGDVEALKHCECPSEGCPCASSQDGIVISWTAPKDTGFGPSGPVVELLSYEIVHSTCSNFGPPPCQTRQASISAGCSSCQFVIAADVLEEVR